MSNLATAQANRLRAQREAYMARQLAARTSSKAITKREVAQIQSTVDARVAAQQAANQVPQTHTVSMFGGLIKYTVPMPSVPTVTQQVEGLATQDSIDQVSSIMAGQATELAQLRQAVLVLAQSTKAVETNTTTVIDSIDVVRADMALVKKQTRKVIKPFDTLTKELNKYWREVIEDTIFFNHDAGAVTAGRGLRSILSFGTAAPEAIHAAKRECFAHLKAIRAIRDRIEATYEYAVTNYPSETAEWMSEHRGVLTVGSKSWTLMDACKNTFIPELQTALYKLRALPV